MRTFLVLILLVSISSCGKSDSSAGIPVRKKILPVNGSNIVGIYMAKFETLNGNVNGILPGSATLQRQNDEFRAYVRLFGGGPNVWHRQNIYMGGRCPTISDDTNGDQVIDIAEAKAVIGKILIPLDANLNSQFAGRNIYPVSDSSGSYFYEREASFNLLFNDLKAEDNDLSDNMMKIPAASGLEFEGMVVMIQGTSETAPVPVTAVGEDGRSAIQSLPIACGVFGKVTSIPQGETDTSTIPGPTEEPPTNPDIDPEDEDEETREERDRWYDRVIDWWRRSWNDDRDGRTQDWGDGTVIVNLT